MSGNPTVNIIEADQVDNIVDTFYMDMRNEDLGNTEQEDVAFYSLYGDGSITPYYRTPSPLLDPSQLTEADGDGQNPSQESNDSRTDSATCQTPDSTLDKNEGTEKVSKEEDIKPSSEKEGES